MMNWVIPGWTCAKCGVFNGEVKEPKLICRSCDNEKPQPTIEDAQRELNEAHVKYRAAKKTLRICGKGFCKTKVYRNHTLCKRHRDMSIVSERLYRQRHPKNQ